ncbi:MAG: signal peptidase I [Dehalococcoidales bacterium]|nr:signal peptidase I [Dehalococcoidales bacterium]
MRDFIKLLLFITISVGAISVVSHVWVQNFVVTTSDMEPSISAGERLLISRTAYVFSTPHRGEIVIYDSPTGNTANIKRIIGLPGDIVEIKNSSVFVNGTQLTEPYVKFTADYTLLPFEVPHNRYFVMEDNRAFRHNSPVEWTVSYDDIRGRAWIQTWPPGKWGTVNNFALEPQLVASTMLEQPVPAD